MHDVAPLFRAEVIAPFVAEYAAGRTPNPCLACNARVSFPELVRLADQLGLALVATGRLAGLKGLRKLVDEYFIRYSGEMFEAAREMAGRCDLLVGHFMMYPLSVAALEARKPYASVTYWPGLIPTAERPPGRLPNLSKLTNLLCWRVVQHLFDRLTLSDARGLLARAGLPARRHVWPELWLSDRLNLAAASPTLWQPAPGWGGQHRICGFFRMPDEAEPWEPPPGLKTFLEAGPPPVYLGLGSSQQVDPLRSVQFFVEAARLAGCRALIHTTTPEHPADSVDGPLCFFGRGPHDRVFASCAAVVHHGGAGTTHTATRAGCPSVVTALMDEQHDWGWQLHGLGLAPRPLWYPKASPAELARAIRRVLDEPGFRERAAAAGERIRAENGVARAVELLERMMREGPVA